MVALSLLMLVFSLLELPLVESPLVQVSSLNPSWAAKLMASLPTLTVALPLAAVAVAPPATPPVSASTASATAAPPLRRCAVTVGPRG
ncbi:hypothetical protein B1987_13550 [Mycobacterium kansasii]|nr:hypothetical protein B1987_13550 [Mycobacterium kansasii]